MVKTVEQQNNNVSQYAIQCSYCIGSVPHVIAKYCDDRKCYFHPGRYVLHKSDWPCPQSDENHCSWCMHDIMEHEDVMECSVCLCTLHTQCYAEHCPCPNGWEKKKGSTPNAPLGDGAEAEPDLPQPMFPAPAHSSFRASFRGNSNLSKVPSVHGSYHKQA